ncbi:MAG: sulfatase [Balneolales bacterium]
MLRKVILSSLTAVILLIANLNLVAQSSTDGNPNIVLIYMDDMGYGDIGVTGSIDYSTPNIDKMSSQSMQFTNFYSVSAICSASRAGLLTGAYPNRVGITGALFPDSEIGLNSEEETIADLLKGEGYATSIVGKWHLGDAEEFLPLQHGFDEYFGLPYSNDMWPVDYDDKPVTDTTKWAYNMPPLPLIEGNETVEYIRTLQDQDMLTTRYTEKAVNFIMRKKEQPFFLYFAHSMPHVPLGVSEKFRGKSKQGLYGDMMMEVDWSVGQIIKTLEDNGIDDNTIVIFTSDNGPWLNYGNHAGSAGGLREGKQTTWEGGQRVPAIMHWPGIIPEGTVNNKLTSTIDLLPTIAAITGASLPSRPIDGVNILPLLTGDENANPRNTLYYYYNDNDLQAVRQDHWKLVMPHEYSSYEDELPGQDGFPGSRHRVTAELALYNLRRDPGERYDVKDQNPELITEIMKLVEQARKDLGDNLVGEPGNNRRAPGSL